MGGTTSKDNFTILENEIDKQNGLLKFLKQHSQYTCLTKIINGNIKENVTALQESNVLTINYKYLDNIKNIEAIQFPCIIYEARISKNSLAYLNGIEEHTEAQNVLEALIESTINSFDIKEITKLRKKTQELINGNDVFIKKSTNGDDTEMIEEKNNILQEYRNGLDYIIKRNSKPPIIKEEPKQIKKAVPKEIQLLDELSIIRSNLVNIEIYIDEIGWKDLFNTEDEILQRDKLMAEREELINRMKETIRELNIIYPLLANINKLKEDINRLKEVINRFNKIALEIQSANKRGNFIPSMKQSQYALNPIYTYSQQIENNTNNKEKTEADKGKKETLLTDLEYYRMFIDGTYQDKDKYKYVVLSISKTLECIKMKYIRKNFNHLGYSREQLDIYLYSTEKIKEIIDKRIMIIGEVFMGSHGIIRGMPVYQQPQTTTLEKPKQPITYDYKEYEIYNKYKNSMGEDRIPDYIKVMLTGELNVNYSNYIDSDLIYVIFGIEYLTEKLGKTDDKGKQQNITLELKTLNEHKTIIEKIIQELQELQKEKVLDVNTIIAYYNRLPSIHKDIFKKYFATYYTKIKASLPTMTGAGGKIKRHAKKEILGKERCIYKKTGDRKEYVKHKGRFITVRDYKKLMKPIRRAVPYK